MSSRTIEPAGFGGYAPQSVDEGQESISVIDRYSNFDGTYHSTRDLRIEGQVKGTIECRGTLHIAQGANIDAKVEAENISVAGELEGEITCRGKLQLLPSGRVRGKINTVTLVIHEGAFYEGELEMAAPDNRLGGRSNRSRSILSSNPSGPVPLSNNDADATETQAATTGGASSTFIRRFGGQEQQWDDARGQEPGQGERSDS